MSCIYRIRSHYNLNSAEVLERLSTLTSDDARIRSLIRKALEIRKGFAFSPTLNRLDAEALTFMGAVLLELRGEYMVRVVKEEAPLERPHATLAERLNTGVPTGKDAPVLVIPANQKFRGRKYNKQLVAFLDHTLKGEGIVVRTSILRDIAIGYLLVNTTLTYAQVGQIKVSDLQADGLKVGPHTLMLPEDVNLLIENHITLWQDRFPVSSIEGWAFCTTHGVPLHDDTIRRIWTMLNVKSRGYDFSKISSKKKP